MLAYKPWKKLTVIENSSRQCFYFSIIRERQNYELKIWNLWFGADKTDHFGVEFVKINDKRIAKTYNILEFPALTFFKKGNAEPVFYSGDMENTDMVLEFLTSQQSMDNPDRIEEVNEKILKKLVAETNYVAVLFCKFL